MSTATESFIESHRHDDIATLALLLRKHPEVDAEFALRQIEGWQRLQHKVPAWTLLKDLHYPPRLSLEQCSGQATAEYKAELAGSLFPDGGTMVDLTGGLGVDFSFIAQKFSKATYVERQAALCHLASHNLPLLGLPDAQVVQAEAENFLREMPPADLIFLDPARRDRAGRKTILIEDCEPDVVQLKNLLLQKAQAVMLKLSPMLDLQRAISTLGCVAEAHVISVKGECKDLILVLTAESGVSTRITCSEGAHRLTFTQEEEQAALPEYTAEISQYLYEPCASIMKAGAFKLCATRYGLKKLHPNSHLYTSESLVPDFPGRIFKVQRCTSFAKQELRAFCSETTKANLTVRNFPATVADLRRKLKLREGGNSYWFATTLADGNKKIIAGEPIKH